MNILPSRVKCFVHAACATSIVFMLGCQPPADRQAAVASEPSSGNTAATQVWRFAIEESVGSVQYAYAREFKRLIEDRMDGVRVVVYPYGTLGTSTQITEQLNMGVLEFAMASPGSLGKFIPELQVFLLHFLLPENERQKQELFTNPKLLAFFDRLYRGKGLQLLSIYSEGEMVWTLKKKVRSPQDFKGVKMRVMTSPILLAAYAAYGASPTPMPYSEVYSGLQLNMIDGQVNPVFAIERQKFYEVTDWMILPGHTSFVTTCATNLRFMQGLPSQTQEIVQEVIEELDEFIFQKQVNFNHERLKTILLEKREKQAEINIVGDLEPFVSTLSAEEEDRLLTSNPRLNLLPALNSAERAAFREACSGVEQLYLQIGGDHASAALDLIQQLSD